MKRFLDLADLSREQVVDLLALAQRLQSSTPSRRRSPARCSGLLFLNPSLRTLASFQAGMARLGGTSFVDHAGPGHLAARDAARRRDERRRAPSTCAKAIPVLASYCDALGIRAFAEGKDLAADLAETQFQAMADLVRQAARSTWSRRSTIPARRSPTGRRWTSSPCPRTGKFVLSLGEPSARAAARRARRDRAHGRAARHGSRGAAARRLRAARSRSWHKARAAAAASGGTVTETTDRAAALNGAHVLYAKEWGSPAHYGDADGRGASCASRSRDWCVRRDLVRAARGPTANSCTACRCAATSRWPTQCSTARAASCMREADNRMVVQMAVLHRLLASWVDSRR